MINTTAPLFTESNFQITIERQQAELYSRLFALMAEDFPTNSDLQIYIKELTQAILRLQQQLTSLFQIVSTHTHTVPPHTHAIIPHTHISASPGSPTSPNVGGYITGPTPLISNVPVQTGSIKWVTVNITDIRNTTGAIQNLAGSRIIIGPSLDGPLIQSKRRMKTPEILNTTKTVPPILKGSIFS